MNCCIKCTKSSTNNSSKYCEKELPTGIDTTHRIITTIGKHVISKDALSCSGEYIAIDKSTHCRVIISALEIVERGLSVLRLSARHIFA